MAMMKAVRVLKYGGPEQLRVENVPIPPAGPGEVLVRVRATSVNPFDYKLASGAYKEAMPMPMPYSPGGDFAGVVEAVGEGVTNVRKGEAVFGNSPYGAYAQFVVAPAGGVAGKPAALSDVEAASVPVAGQTAWQGLFDHGQLAAGQTVLIHAAAGGVGSFAVQLAHWKGARVLATASAANADYLRSLGADGAIDYRATRFETVARDVDVVLDLVGGETQSRSVAVLKGGGHLISTTSPPSDLVKAEAAKRGIQAQMMVMQASTANLQKLAELLEAGKIRTVVAKTYPLADASRAWSEAMAGHTRGKVVLEAP